MINTFIKYLNPKVINEIREKENKKEIKIKSFEYLIYLLCKWWIEENPEKPWVENDLSTLKVMKLLFLISSVNSNSENDGLLNVFDNWYAEPFGPNEKDIYMHLRECDGQFSWFKISNQRIEFTAHPPNYGNP